MGLPEIIAALLFVSLNAYVLSGGADLGGGVWDLLATGPRRARQRRAIAAAIGPIWEANHVWLVIAVVICFTAFPAVFALLTTVLHIPLALMLVGIVLRGSAFVFRSYGTEAPTSRATWGRTFAIASALTPVLLGMVIGAIASGRVARAGQQIGTASFNDVFVAPWFDWFPLAIGMLTLALFAQLAATYLTVVTESAELRNDFRSRALLASAAAAGTGAIAAALAHGRIRPDGASVLTRPEAWGWLLVTVTAAAVAMMALWQRRFRLARAAAGAEVSLVLWGWAAVQYPWLVPSDLTIRGAAAPGATLKVLLSALLIGAVLLIPALAYLLRTFATRHD